MMRDWEVAVEVNISQIAMNLVAAPEGMLHSSTFAYALTHVSSFEVWRFSITSPESGCSALNDVFTAIGRELTVL